MRELAERLMRIIMYGKVPEGQNIPLTHSMKLFLPEIEIALTDFAAEQQRVGAERMLPHLEWALSLIPEQGHGRDGKACCATCGVPFNAFTRKFDHNAVCRYSAAIRAIAVKTEDSNG